MIQHILYKDKPAQMLRCCNTPWSAHRGSARGRCDWFLPLLRAKLCLLCLLSPRSTSQNQGPSAELSWMTETQRTRKKTKNFKDIAHWSASPMSERLTVAGPWSCVQCHQDYAACTLQLLYLRPTADSANDCGRPAKCLGCGLSVAANKYL